MRKCLGSSEEWEDVGDNIAREKTSQVLRDALTARKSFSGNEEQSHTNEKNLRMKSGRKEPPQEMRVATKPLQLEKIANTKLPLITTEFLNKNIISFNNDKVNQ